MKIAGHHVTEREMVALHAIYKDLIRNGKVYGVSIRPQLSALADRGVIARTGIDAYMIPYDSPGARIVAASLDFMISSHI